MRKVLMKKVLVILLTAIISGTMILMLSGCAQKIAESMVEKAIEDAAGKEGDNVDIDLEEGQVNITDEEGNEISIGGAEVPEDWPSVVPVNDNIAIQFTGSQKTDNKMNWSLSGTYSGTGEELYNYYKNEMSGWNEESSTVSDAGDDGKTYSLQVSNDQYYVSLFITESEDSPAVILGVNEK